MPATTPKNSVYGVLCIAAFIGALGCSGEKSDLAPVRGKVLLNDQPMEFGRVMTVPQAGRGSAGEIQPDGTFMLTTNDDGDGAAIGVHKVAVTTMTTAPVADPEAVGAESQVPARYSNPETSKLTIEVKADGENSPVLKLTSP
jgi:hypothetical protein